MFILLVAYTVCAVIMVIVDRVVTRGRCPECRGQCIHRDWMTSLAMGAVWPLTVALFAVALIFGDSR